MPTDPSVVTVLTAWSFEPSVYLGIALVAWIYIVGLRALARRGRLPRTVAPRHITYFALGLLSILLALVSPIDTLSDRLLAVHMIQHLLLLLIAPPLLLLGNPVPVLLVGAPHGIVRSVARAHLRSASFRNLTHLIVNPFVAWPLFVGTALAWHLPALYDAAPENTAIHLLEHICFLVTGILFWIVIVQPFPGPHRLDPGWRLLFILAATLPDAVLGLVFILVGSPIYPFYADLPRTWGISVMDDQALAGNIMFVGGDLVLVCAMIPLFADMMNRFEKRELATWAAELESEALTGDSEQHVGAQP